MKITFPPVHYRVTMTREVDGELVGPSVDLGAVTIDPAQVLGAQEVGESNLVSHARHELELVESDPWMTEGLVKVVQAFADMGHSGSSAAHATAVLHELFQFKNLSPLTDDPAEWYDHGDCYQNKRCGEAFSHDGGKTYYLLSDRDTVLSATAKGGE